MNTARVQADLLQSTKLADDSLGQVMAFLNRLGDRGVQIGTLHAVRAEDILADTLATLMQRLAGEYFVIRAFRKYITAVSQPKLDLGERWEWKVLQQHYGVGHHGVMSPDCAIALCDLLLAVPTMIMNQFDVEELIRTFETNPIPGDPLNTLQFQCHDYRDRWGTSAGIEFLCPIYVPEKLSGVKQINPRLLVLAPEAHAATHNTPKLTID
ncbi:MAG: hypothetical protein HY975_03050 [Candidatus Kerfeldbacteria bacterium]|nr:hypothetical protein [Candidatus Kerfeldbacteria bacterium]